MEISEIEKFIGECKCNGIPQTERAVSLSLIQGVMYMHNAKGNFCKLAYDELIKQGYTSNNAYRIECKEKLEDKMATFAIYLFRLVNTYHMNVQSLRLDGKTPSKDFEELVYSMVKISMTHYRIQKKIIILLGMLCSFCISENIDLLWFVERRLLIDC